eukprot:356055-Chlamydomonas_euryale.AAC.2
MFADVPWTECYGAPLACHMERCKVRRAGRWVEGGSVSKLEGIRFVWCWIRTHGASDLDKCGRMGGHGRTSVGEWDDVGGQVRATKRTCSLSSAQPLVDEKFPAPCKKGWGGRKEEKGKWDIEGDGMEAKGA